MGSHEFFRANILSRTMISKKLELEWAPMSFFDDSTLSSRKLDKQSWGLVLRVFSRFRKARKNSYVLASAKPQLFLSSFLDAAKVRTLENPIDFEIPGARVRR